jgi:hypothetical protein
VSNTKIITFAQETLGCKCPEEVFALIDCQRDIELSPQILLTNKINIGNRLLVYIIQTDDINFFKSNLPAIVQFGIKERNSKAFNRVRFVIVAEKPEELKPVAANIFKDLASKDEKIHLHVINKKEFTQF